MRILSSLICWRRHYQLPRLHQAIVNDRVRESDVRKTKRLEKVDSKGRTILHIAGMTGHQGAIDAIVEEADRRRQRQKIINMKDKDGNTPLHLASQNGCKICIRLLYNAGCDGTILNKRGESPARDVDDNDQQSCAQVQSCSSPDLETGKGLALGENHCTNQFTEAAVNEDSCSLQASVPSFQVSGDCDKGLVDFDSIKSAQKGEEASEIGLQHGVSLIKEMEMNGLVKAVDEQIRPSQNGAAKRIAILIFMLFTFILMLFVCLHAGSDSLQA